jgi:hypothetical protein
LDKFLFDYRKVNENIPENVLFFSQPIFWEATIDEEHFLTAADLVWFGNEYAIDRATALYEDFLKGKFSEAAVSKKNFWTMGFLFFELWKSENLKPIRIDYNINQDFSIMRTIEFHRENKRNLFTFITLIKKILTAILPYGLIVHRKAYLRNRRNDHINKQFSDENAKLKKLNEIGDTLEKPNLKSGG